ncbi:NB protein, partial [Influenza B virus]
TPN